MKYLPTLLFVYCSLFIFLLLASGISSAKSPSDFLLQLLFLPLVVHFFSVIVRKFKQKKHPAQIDSDTEQKRFSLTSPVFLLTCVLFIFLLGTSIVLVMQKAAYEAQQLLSPLTSRPETQVKREEPNELAVTPAHVSLIRILSEDNSLINIRAEASSGAKVITKVKNAQTFPFISDQNSWYEVQLPGGEKGFVNKQFAVLENSLPEKETYE